MTTGGAGFLGSHLVEKLHEQRCRQVFTPRSHEYDLRDSQAVIRLFDCTRPDIVIHLAGVVGGIGANRAMGTERRWREVQGGIDAYDGDGAGSPRSPFRVDGSGGAVWLVGP